MISGTNNSLSFTNTKNGVTVNGCNNNLRIKCNTDWIKVNGVNNKIIIEKNKNKIELNGVNNSIEISKNLVDRSLIIDISGMNSVRIINSSQRSNQTTDSNRNRRPRRPIAPRVNFKQHRKKRTRNRSERNQNNFSGQSFIFSSFNGAGVRPRVSIGVNPNFGIRGTGFLRIPGMLYQEEEEVEQEEENFSTDYLNESDESNQSENNRAQTRQYDREHIIPRVNFNDFLVGARIADANINYPTEIEEDNLSQDENCQKCSICIAPLDRIKVPTIILDECQHEFHYECIEDWSQRVNTCPNCRKEFDIDF